MRAQPWAWVRCQTASWSRSRRFCRSEVRRGAVRYRENGRASMICEICVDSVAGVRAAKDAGAQRVELCADLLEARLTPSLGMIRQARTVTGIDINVMIRPRGGDFLFNDDEFASMQVDIKTAKAEGANGVVIGLLASAGGNEGGGRRRV